MLTFNFLNIYLLSLKESESSRVHTRAEEGQRENPKQSPHCQCRTWCGAQTRELWDHDLSRNQESDAQPTEPPRHPSTPAFLKIIKQLKPVRELPVVFLRFSDREENYWKHLVNSTPVFGWCLSLLITCLSLTTWFLWYNVENLGRFMRWSSVLFLLHIWL